MNYSFILSFYFSGQNCIVIVSSANLKLNENDLKAAEDVIKSAKVLVTQMEILPTTSLAAMKIAKKYGGKCQIIFFFNSKFLSI